MKNIKKVFIISYHSNIYLQTIELILNYLVHFAYDTRLIIY